MSSDRYKVEVHFNHKQLITIETDCYYGKGDLTEKEKNIIRDCAHQLLSLVGEVDPEPSGQPLSDDDYPF